MEDIIEIVINALEEQGYAVSYSDVYQRITVNGEVVMDITEY